MIRKSFHVLGIFVLLFLSRQGFTESKVYFSPNGGCDKAVISWIDKSSSTLDIAIFTLTKDDIADSIIRAHKRGVKVRVIADNMQSKCKGADIDRLSRSGIPVVIPKHQGFMHNKYIVIDSSTVVTGSYNFTNNATFKNDENLIIIADIGGMYSAAFEILWQRWSSIIYERTHRRDK